MSDRSDAGTSDDSDFESDVGSEDSDERALREMQERTEAEAEQQQEQQQEQRNEPQGPLMERNRTDLDERYATIVGPARRDLLPPGAPDAPTPNERATTDRVLESMKESYEASIKEGEHYEPYDPDKAFEGIDGASPADRELWKLWDERIRKMRRRDWTTFLGKVQYHEDLTYGPRDGGRIWSHGFERDERGQIQWDYWMTSNLQGRPISKKRANQSSDVVMQVREESGDKGVTFRPCRRRKRDQELRHMRRLFGSLAMDRDTGETSMSSR